jgi:hypothetical protein
MIALLITLILVALLWMVIRTVFAGHPKPVPLVIDVLFLVIVIVLICRWAGLL